MSISNISFKNAGYRDEEVFNFNILRTGDIQEFPIGIKLPLRRGFRTNETIFAMNFDIESQIKDNLKFLLTCRKNEILMKPNYGTNLSSLFSSTNLDEDDLNNLAREEISGAVELYANPMQIDGQNYFINLVSYSIREDPNDSQKSFYYLEIEYNISGYSQRDIEIIKKIQRTGNNDYLTSKLNKIIIKFRTSN